MTLSLNNLGFTINQQNLFSNINVTFLPSAIICIQGENGSGKTSLLRMVAGVQAPSRGNIFYNSKNIQTLEKPYCNYIGHNLGLKLEMTVLENLQFWANIYNSSELLAPAIHYFHLYELLDQKCYQLSEGRQKLIALAKLIACHSHLWLLDEVETNLSKKNRELLNNLIVFKANSGGVIIMTSHQSPEIKSAQILNLENFL